MKKNNSLYILISTVCFAILFFTVSVASADVKNVNWGQAAQEIGCGSEQVCRAKYNSLNPDTLEGARDLQEMWSFFNTQKGVYTQAERKTLSDTQQIIVAKLGSAQNEDEFNQAVLDAAKAIVQKNPELAKKYGISNQEVRRVEQEQKASDALEQAMQKFNCGGGDADECGKDFEGAIANGKDTALYEQIALQADKNAGNKSNSVNSYYAQYKQMIKKFNEYVQLPPSPEMYRPPVTSKMSKEAMLAFCDANSPNPAECKKGIERSFSVVSPNQLYPEKGTEEGIVDMGNGVYRLGDMLSKNRADFEPRTSLHDFRCPIAGQASLPPGCFYSIMEKTSYLFNGIQCQTPKLICKDYPVPVYPTTPSQPPYDVLGKKFDTIDEALSFCRSIVTAVPVPICMELAARNNNLPPPAYPKPLVDCAAMPATVKADFEIVRSGQIITDQARHNAMAKYASCMVQPLYPMPPGSGSYVFVQLDGISIKLIRSEAMARASEFCYGSVRAKNESTCTQLGYYSGNMPYPMPIPGMPPSTNNWVNHIWNFRDGSTQFSSILNRTDKEYIDFIASKDAEARTGYFNGWEPGGGNQSIWREFGIPKISTTPSITQPLTPAGQREQIWNSYGLRSWVRTDADQARIEQLKEACKYTPQYADVWMGGAGSMMSADFGMPDLVKCRTYATPPTGTQPPYLTTGVTSPEEGCKNTYPGATIVTKLDGNYCHKPDGTEWKLMYGISPSSPMPATTITDSIKCAQGGYYWAMSMTTNSYQCFPSQAVALAQSSVSSYNSCGMGKYAEYSIPMPVPGVGFNAPGIGQGTCFKPGMMEYVDVSGMPKLCSTVSILGCMSNSSVTGTSSSGDTCSKYMTILPGAHMHGGNVCVGNDEQSWVYATDLVISSSVKNACTTAVPSGVGVSCSSTGTTSGTCPSGYTGTPPNCAMTSTGTYTPTSCPSGQYSCNNICIPNTSSCTSIGTYSTMPVGGCPSGQYWNGYSCITSTPPPTGQFQCPNGSYVPVGTPCPTGSIYTPPNTSTYQAPGVACATAGGTWNTSSNYCQMPGMTTPPPTGTYTPTSCPSGQYSCNNICIPNTSSCISTGSTYTPLPTGTYSIDSSAIGCTQYGGTWDSSKTPPCQMPGMTTTTPTMTPDQGCKQSYGSAASWDGSKCIGGTSPTPPTASIIDTFRYWFSRP